MSQDNKIYIGNLSYDATENMLDQHFRQYGTITDVALIKDRNTGRSKGFAFITFDSSSGAKSALTAMNHTEFMGRRLNVNLARERDRSGGSGRRSSSRSSWQ